jgi:hypothetical protein
MKVKLAALGALLAAILVVWGVVSLQRGKAAQEALESYETASRIDTRIDRKVEKRVAARTRVEAREDMAVEKALKEAPEWAAEEVPPDVLKALRE